MKTDETKEKSELVQELEEQRRRGAERAKKRVADAELSLAFLSGNQWTRYSLADGIKEIENPEDEIRITDNLMLPAYRRWFHYMFQNQPVLTAFEGGKELADAERAAVSARIAEYWELHCGLRQAREEAAGDIWSCGISFLAPIWRKNKGKKRKKARLEYREQPKRDKAGRLSFVETKEVREYEGEMTFENYSPLQSYWFPLAAKRWEKVEQFMTAAIVTAEWVQEHVPEEIDTESLEAVSPDEVNLKALEEINNYVSPEFGTVDGSETDYVNGDRYLMIQRWRRPCKKHPRGQYVLYVGGRVVRETELPYIDAARRIDPGDNFNLTMGIIPSRAMHFPHRLVPPSPASTLRQPQVRWNDLLTDESINRKTVGRSKLIYEEDKLDDDEWTSEHGEKIPIRPGTNVSPQYIQGHPLTGIQQEKHEARQSFEEASGQTSVLRGQNPTQVRGAFHLDILREESMVLVYAAVDENEKSYKLLVRLALSIAQDKYEPERVIEIYGKDKAGRALTWETAVLNTDITVKTGSMKPKNHAVREAKLEQLLQAGAFVDRDGRPDTQKFWDMTELGTMHRGVDHDQKQRDQATRENVRMLNYGEPVDINEWDDDYIHIEEHVGNMARPEWEEAEENNQAVIMAHIDRHRQAWAEKQQPEIGMDTEPVAGISTDLGTGGAPGPAQGGGAGQQQPQQATGGMQ